jgi:hypothetical protein
MTPEFKRKWILAARNRIAELANTVRQRPLTKTERQQLVDQPVSLVAEGQVGADEGGHGHALDGLSGLEPASAPGHAGRGGDGAGGG